PSSPAWQNATLRNNPLVPPALQLILTPSSVKEVEKIVTFANQYRIVLHPTVSTHGFTKTLTRATPGIQINLTKFNSIRLISKETIEIGGGITAKEVIDFLFKQNLRATTPGCDCISFLGPALGGGTGTYEGIYGLIGDGLVSVDIVTAKGTFRASAKENKELFWALKGAGHNFGIVTSARVRVHPIDKKVDGNEWLDAIFSYEATPSKILQVSAPSSAVAWRRQVITTMMQVAFPISFKGTKTEKQIFELGEKGRALLRKGEKGEKLVYVNYANGDEPQEEMFGRANLERLRALKRKWDGRGVFGGYNPI
ncbi:FAD-binding domain-containing protein, partial [Ascobolus immersus RN42]